MNLLELGPEQGISTSTKQKNKIEFDPTGKVLSTSHCLTKSVVSNMEQPFNPLKITIVSLQMEHDTWHLDTSGQMER